MAHKHGGLDKELKSAGPCPGNAGRTPGLGGPVQATGLTDNRVLVVVEKVAATPDRYPRRTGVPAKWPL